MKNEAVKKEVTSYVMTKYPGIHFVLKEDYDRLKARVEKLTEALKDLTAEVEASDYSGDFAFLEKANKVLEDRA